MKNPKLLLMLSLPLLASCSLTAPGHESPIRQEVHYEGGVRFLLGTRNFTDDDTEPVDNHLMVGLEVHADTRIPDKSWIWGVEYGLAFSRDDDDEFVPGLGDVDVESTSLELYMGVRVSPVLEDYKSIHPYVGAGLSVINLEFDVDTPIGSADDDDTSLAGYIHGGVLFDLNDRWTAGFDLRALLGSDIDIAGVSGDADYFQVAAILGFAF